jgi:mono/diheme cytochrome c family protein
LFDNWIKETKAAFTPDNPDTPALDGAGGPFGNGTLADAQGKPLANSGHNYRFKGLFGWDLRGADGINGPTFRDKPAVLLPNVLTNTDSRDVWISRLTRGEDAIPAYGSVLSAAQIEALVDFMLGVRDGKLPRPDDLFSLTTRATGGYALVPGGDATRGHALFAATCAECHGADGGAWLFDEGQHSLGTLARSEGYEVWLKVLNGQPGSTMGPQLDPNLTRDQQVGALRDLQAALCDRARYPRGKASQEDVADDDPRCGAALR